MQTKGRGTQGRKWVSNKGNLFGSIFFPLKKNFPSFNEFSIINPILISEAIRHFCNKKKVNLKFPNDVFINKKKICGILQEVITSQNMSFLIIGIGINVVSSPEINNSYKATNILLETKKKLKLENLNAKLISIYEEFFFNIDAYNYFEFKKKSELMAIN